MNHLMFSAGLTSLFTFALGLLALSKGPRNRLNQIFTCYSWSIALWSFCFTQLHKIPDPLAIWYGRLLHLGCTFIPAFFLHFALSLSGGYERKKTVVVAAYAVAIGYNLPNLFQGLFTGEIVYREGYAYPRPIGLLYFSYFLFFVASVSYGLFALWKTLPHLPKDQARRLQLFILATSLGYLGGMNNFLIMIDARLFPLFPHGLYAVALYSVVASLVVDKRFFLVPPRSDKLPLVEQPGSSPTTPASEREIVRV